MTALDMEQAIVVTKYDRALDWLGALNGAYDFWQPEPSRWIFRGHSDSRWRLLPRSMRSDMWFGADWGTYTNYEPDAATEYERWSMERHLLKEFGAGLDRVGLSLPDGSHKVMDDFGQHVPNDKHANGVKKKWIHAARGLAALAQHHGVPTRLLDFTERGHVASYFAAAGANSPGDDMCVWAVDCAFLLHGELPPGGFWTTVCRAPRSSNPNLHAQAGLFATWTGSSVGKDQPGGILALDEIVLRVLASRPDDAMCKPEYPILRCLCLPKSEAPDVLRWLEHQGIHAGTMFPGPIGVVQHIREKARRHRRA